MLVTMASYRNCSHTKTITNLAETVVTHVKILFVHDNYDNNDTSFYIFCFSRPPLI
jgi:hypothetical protein